MLIFFLIGGTKKIATVICLSYLRIIEEEKCTYLMNIAREDWSLSVSNGM